MVKVCNFKGTMKLLSNVVKVIDFEQATKLPFIGKTDFAGNEVTV